MNRNGVLYQTIFWGYNRNRFVQTMNMGDKKRLKRTIKKEAWNSVFADAYRHRILNAHMIEEEDINFDPVVNAHYVFDILEVYRVEVRVRGWEEYEGKIYVYIKVVMVGALSEGYEDDEATMVGAEEEEYLDD